MRRLTLSRLPKMGLRRLSVTILRVVAETWSRLGWYWIRTGRRKPDSRVLRTRTRIISSGRRAAMVDDHAAELILEIARMSVHLAGIGGRNVCACCLAASAATTAPTGHYSCRA